MNKNISRFGILALLSVSIFSGCKKDKGETNDEEIITTMILKLTPANGGAPVTFQLDDPDGPGGSTPVTDEIHLSPSTTYAVEVQLLNKTSSLIEDITTEVAEENIAHRFYYQTTANITVSNLDTDDNGVPLGIHSTWITGAAGTGQMTVTLRHYPGEPPGKATDDLVNSAKSGTDITATFNTVIQ